MKFDQNILENYAKLDSELVCRLIDDGLLEAGDLFSIYDMVFKLGTRGALFLGDFKMISDITAIEKAIALRIVVVYRSNKKPEMSFIKLGYNGFRLYRKFGFKEDQFVEVEPKDLFLCGLEMLLGINQFLIKNNLYPAKILKKYGLATIRTLDKDKEEIAYAYPEFIEPIKRECDYTGKIIPIEDDSPKIPWDMCCYSCASLIEVRKDLDRTTNGIVLDLN